MRWCVRHCRARADEREASHLKREVLLATLRWTSLLHPARAGEMPRWRWATCSCVQCGQVTGANAVWILRR